MNFEQEEFIETLNKELKEFFRINYTENMEKRKIWDTSKTFGNTIQNKKNKRKE